MQTSCEKKTTNKIHNKKDLAEIDSILTIGYQYYENNEYDSSYYYFNKAKYAAEFKKDTSRIIHSLSWMAQIQRNQCDYTGSESTSIEALPYIENSNKFPYGETNIYIGLGNNYLYTFDYDHALYYFKKAINSKTDKIIKADIANNIALTYYETGNYSEAIKKFSSLIKNQEVKNHAETFARINDNLGSSFVKSGDLKGLYYLNQGLKIRTRIKDDWGLISSYYHLAEYYYKKKPNLAKLYIQFAYKKATNLNNVDDRLRNLKLLIQNSNGIQSKKYSLLYLRLNDSITKVRQKAKNQFAKIKYDSKKEKQENLKLKEQKAENILQLELQKTTTQLLYFIVVVILCVFGFIYFYLNTRNKREKFQASYATEIQIAKKLHDELANDVYQTMTFAETHDLSTPNNKEILLNNLDTIYSRTRNISKENSNIETGTNFTKSLKEMMSDFNTDTTNIVIKGLDNVNWSLIDNSKKIAIHRVIQELLVNMNKHSKCNLALISFQLNNNTIHLDYSDNGVGIRDQNINKKSGLHNIEKRVADIEGTIVYNLKIDKGFTVNIQFPA